VVKLNQSAARRLRIEDCDQARRTLRTTHVILRRNAPKDLLLVHAT
jgi:hypothetical protein